MEERLLLDLPIGFGIISNMPMKTFSVNRDVMNGMASAAGRARWLTI
jgi:hypothetical protein